MSITAVLGYSPVTWVVLAVLVLIGLTGVVAMVSPKGFTTLARGGGRWVDTRQFFEKLDQPVDIDRVAFRHSRLFGAVVLGSVGVLAYVYCVYLA